MYLGVRFCISGDYADTFLKRTLQHFWCCCHQFNNNDIVGQQKRPKELNWTPTLSVAKRHWNDSTECGKHPQIHSHWQLLTAYWCCCNSTYSQDADFQGRWGRGVRAAASAVTSEQNAKTNAMGLKPTTANVQRQQQRQRSKKCSSQTNHSTRIGIRFLPLKAPPLPTPRLSRTGSKNVPTEDANCCWCLCCYCCCCCGVAAAMLLLRCCYFATADVAASASAALAKAGKQQQVPVAQFSAFTWGLRDGVHWEKRTNINYFFYII